MKKQDKNKLRLWQDRLKTNEAAYDGETSRMDEREALYAGTNEMRPIVQGERKTKAVHVRNICAEIIEAQTDSNIPKPKVTARRKQDEMKAKLIEDMLRNELDRMPFEQLNDIMERTVPIQGGAAFLVEWDNTQRTHFTIGSWRYPRFTRSRSSRRTACTPASRTWTTSSSKSRRRRNTSAGATMWTYQTRARKSRTSRAPVGTPRRTTL